MAENSQIRSRRPTGMVENKLLTHDVNNRLNDWCDGGNRLCPRRER